MIGWNVFVADLGIIEESSYNTERNNMSLLEHFLNTLSNLTPTAIALLLTILAIMGARYIINRRQGSDHTVRRQVVTMLLSFIGLLIVIMIIPNQYLSETSTGQLLSLIGILLSAAIALSSTTFIGNAMAGLMLRSVKSFKPGDFVRIGDHFGRVTERGLFHIEIQTEDRDLTTLPNLYLVTNPVKVILSSGTIVTAEVSLAYDIPHADIENCLKEAALGAGLTDPFVLIMELGDFSVTYRAAGMLTEVKHLISTRSDLRKMMMDSLHKRGIEIVSPNFMNTRALPEQKTIIPKNSQPLSTESPEKRTAIEKLVFDIADEAESIEKLNEMLEETVKEIDAMKSQVKETLSKATKDNIKLKIEQLEARRETIGKLIEKTSAEKEGQ